MIDIILYTSLLAFIHAILPNSVKSKFGQEVFERAKKAAHNFAESLPIFFVLAILSIYLSVEENEMVALIWLCLRIIFGIIYVSGINTKPADSKGYQAQPLRSLVWIGSIICLIDMGTNLA